MKFLTRFLPFMLAILTGFTAYGQIIIGTSSLPQRHPFNYFFGFGRDAAIYTAAEMNTVSAGGTITSISFFSNLSSGWTTRPTRILFRFVGGTTVVPSDTWANTLIGTTQVYSGTPGWINGWNAFSVNIAVPAGSNLMILVECNATGSGAGPFTGNAFFYTPAGTNNHATWEQDGSAPGGNPLRNELRPNIRLGGLVPLPLELKSFTGQVQGNVNILNWETLTEKNVQSHLVERSVDGTRWSEIGTVAGKGDSQVSVKYSLEDRAPLAKAYYRLRSVDFDGQESRSASIVLTHKGDHFGITSVYPSPTTNNLTVQFNSTSEEKVTVRVLDMTGRLVLEQYTEAVKDINELPIVLTGLQAGVYSVTVSNSTGVSAPMRFVKE